MTNIEIFIGFVNNSPHHSLDHFYGFHLFFQDLTKNNNSYLSLSSVLKDRVTGSRENESIDQVSQLYSVRFYVCVHKGSDRIVKPVFDISKLHCTLHSGEKVIQCHRLEFGSRRLKLKSRERRSHIRNLDIFRI